jgi:acetate kinase
MSTNEAILVINSGSSSIKFSIFVNKNNFVIQKNFDSQKSLDLLYHGIIDKIFDSPCLTIFNTDRIQILTQNISSTGHESGLRAIFAWLIGLDLPVTLTAVGHRVVHGGMFFFGPTLIDAKVIEKIHPKLSQIACFDTTFHHTQCELATLFAIPKRLTDDGIIRYGFHGISYEYIASVIKQHLGDIGHKRVIMAHLGNGSSMCAMNYGKSVATSMGFTALDGLMMGTRCGRIDSGVLLYLMQYKNYTAKQLENLLYNESGLLGVSGVSHDMRELLAKSAAESSKSSESSLAVELFCYMAALEFGSLAVALGGCDALVFTAGIGENAAIIRQKICEYLLWLGINLNDAANKKNASIISDEKSKIVVSVIPTDEEYMIAKHVYEFMR